jgi:tetratricopeptide (TPR) repeat protein
VADIFVSFTKSDQQWAHWIAQELTALHHEPHVHDWEIGPGKDILSWMEKRHDQADYVLCVVSPDYLSEDKAPFSTWERRAALWRMVKRRKGHVLLLVVKPVRLPSLIDHFRRCDLVGLREEEARRRVAEFLRTPSPPEKIDFPGEDGIAISNVPIAVPKHFVGREDALQAVDAALKRHDGRVAVTAVHGLRGVGKTTLAAAYAEHHRSEYRATWWVRAQRADLMRADLVSLGVRLGWLESHEKEGPAFESVMERLRREGEGLLLVYDGATYADALKPFLPKGGATRAIVTSNAPDWRGLAAPIELKLWPKAIGADYLIARTGCASERVEAETLSEALGGLALAHEQAAAYCERLSVSFADYERRLAATPVKVLDAERDAPLGYHDKRTVAKTFSLAIDEASRLHPATEPLITLAASLAPEPIPLFLFSEGREKFGEPLSSQLADDGLDEAVAALRAFALVDRAMIVDERDPTVTTETIRLHRLVRIAAASRQPEQVAEAGRAVLIDAMAAVYPREVRKDPTIWPTKRRLDALALDLISANPRAMRAEATATLLDGLASYRKNALGAYAAARALYELALAIREEAFGPEHPSTAESLNSLALVLRDLGELSRARELSERALAIREKKLGPEHHLTAGNLNDLALVLRGMGELSRARALYERALAIQEKTLDPNHYDTAVTLDNLASLLRYQGEIGRGRLFCERALAIFEKTLGPHHPDTAITLGNLAYFLSKQGDVGGARGLVERAVAIHEKLHPDHPSTATDLSSLANLLEIQGDPAGARLLYERSLAINQKTFGVEHPKVATDLNSLADLAREQGDFARARSLYERALAIRELALGKSHRESFRIRVKLKTLYLEQILDYMSPIFDYINFKYATVFYLISFLLAAIAVNSVDHNSFMWSLLRSATYLSYIMLSSTVSYRLGRLNVTSIAWRYFNATRKIFSKRG